MMKMKKVISIICLISMVFETVPVSAVTNYYKNTELIEADNFQLKEKIENEKIEENSGEIRNEEVITDEFISLENNNVEENNIEENNNGNQIPEEKPTEEKPKEENKEKSKVIITGSESIRVYVGEKFDYKEGVTATDSKGNDISSLVTVRGEVNNSKVGTYELEYSVTDNFGETAIFKRKVKVIEKNIFNAFIEKFDEKTNEKVKESLFSIYLDNKTSKFVVDNQSENQIDPSRMNETAFKIRVLDKDNKEKISINLLGGETGNSEKLNPLKELKYSYGDFIEINPMGLMKNGFNIEGPILGDIDIKKEDYSDGVDNEDYILNVRFKIVEDGIEAIYNEAPVISGLEIMDNLLNTRENQLAGVKVTDDHDKEISNDKIKISEEKDGENNVIGLRYEVSDSWGRSVSMLRELKAKSSKIVEEDTNATPYNINVLKNNIIEVHGIEYPDNDTLRFKLKFNQDTKKVEITDRDTRLFDNKIKDEYFRLNLYDKYGSLKRELVINGSYKADSKVLDEFNNSSFEFGDQIYLFHKYSRNKLKIKGKITDADFNHLEGIEAEKLVKHRFSLEQGGLKYLSNNPPTITWPEKKLEIPRGKKIDLLKDITVLDDLDGEINKSRVEVTDYNPNQLGDQIVIYTVRDSWGEVTTAERIVTITADNKLTNTSINIMNSAGTNKVFSINFDSYEKRIKLVETSNNKLDESNPNDLTIRIRVISKAGITKKEIRLNGNDDGFNNALNDLNNFRYSISDTIELWASNPKEGIEIIGEIEKDKEIVEDYSDGIDNKDFMTNVRFELGEDTLIARYNKAPEIIFENDLTITRGEGFDLLSFVKEIKDDHDQLNKKLVKIKYNKEEINDVGTHTVSFTVSDKWGRPTSVDKEFKVIAKNKLEETNIKLIKSGSNNIEKPILTLYFDDVKKKIHADYEKNEIIAGESNTDVFTVTVFDSNGKVKAKSTIKANEGLNDDSLKEVSNINIEYNDGINVVAYANDKVTINGYVTSNNKDILDYSNGFQNDDKMINTRFRVTEDGLKEVYNEAPELHGIENISIVKGQDFNSLQGVTITDDHDTNISINSIIVTGSVDNGRIGTQAIKYKATDSWGRSVEQERIITVMSNTINNFIELKDSRDALAFKIGFDLVTNKFTLSEESSNQINPSNSESEFFMAVVNRDNNIVKQVNILGSDTGDSTKIKELTKTTIRSGYKFYLWTKTPKKLSVKGNITNGTGIDEDYSNGVDNKDFIENVAFIITEDGLETIYNSAPVINLQAIANNKLTLYKGDDYRSDLLNRVKVTDDHDTFTSEVIKERMEITAKKPNENNVLQLTEITDIGDYEVTYTIKDSWGRISSEEKRNIEIIPAIDRNVINFGGYSTVLRPPEFVVFKLVFDSATNTINLRDREDRVFNNGASRSNNYTISIYNADGSKKIEPITVATWDKGTTDKLTPLEGLNFQYGDYIDIKAYQAFRMSIDGAVRNGLEDYSDKIQLVEDFLYTSFKITEAGLEAKYEPERLNENESLIEYIGTNGGSAFKIKFDHNTKGVSFPNTVEAYNWAAGDKIVFKAHLYKKLENRIYTYESAGKNMGTNTDLRNKLKSGFDDGDYLNIELIDIPKNSIGVRIRGKISEENKNYAEKVQGHNDIKNVRFYLRSNDTEKYLDPVYNYGPQFKGIDDINIYEENMATFNPNDGVTVTDDHDTTVPSYTVTSPVDSNGNTITLDRVGKYVYTYSSTDSWGRTTTVQRNVYVRPSIFKNKIMLYAKEQISTKNNVYSNQIEPAFVIGFDNDTGKYSVTNQVNKEINSNVGDNLAFKISVYNQSGIEKGVITLNGTDTGTSEKLEELKKIDYDDGDYIRLWSEDSKYLVITGDVSGDVKLDKEDYKDGIDNSDYMNNVAFKLSYGGIETIHNNAPQINGLKDKEVLFGEKINLKEGLSVSDDKDNNLTIDNIQTEGTVNENEIGSYKVIYTVSDSWGRSTSQEVTFRVVSKIKSNDIEIYGRSSSDAEEHKFTLKFDVNANKIVVDRVLGTTSQATVIGKYFEMVVRSRSTEEKIRVTLSSDESTWNNELDKLNSITYSNDDTISFYSNDKNNVKIKGNIGNNNGKDFENAFDSSTEFEAARFKITNKGFELIERETLSITFNGALTIKRGDDSELFKDVTINSKNPDNLLGTNLNFEDLNTKELGVYNAKYVLTDSWGQTVKADRKITVAERNKLEENKIKLLNDSNEVLVEFFIDTIENKIVTKRSQNQYTGSETNLVTLTLYDETGITKNSIIVTSNNLNSSSEIEYEYGNSIGISVYDKSKLIINGEIQDKKEDYSNGVENADNIDNVRFQIVEDEKGLKSVYNNAPILEIKGDLILYKNESPDLLKGVTARDIDPHDTEVSEADIQIDTELDVTHTGDYTATYTIADTWGRKTTKNRDIIVKSSLENTKIQYYPPSEKSPAFEIAIDNINNQFKVIKNYSSFKNIFKNIFKQSDSKNDEKVFEVIVFDEKGNIKKSIEILNNSNKSDVDNQLNEFNNYPYKYGDYISVYAKDHENGIKIIGNIDKPFNITEDYSDGIQDTDFMNNVRFRIDKESLQAVYNEAPKMTILNKDEIIVVYSGDDHNYGENVIVSDDHDLDLGSKGVRISDEDKEKMKKVGTHTVGLIVTDSWGRSTREERVYNVKPSIDRNVINFGGYDKASKPNEFIVFKLEFNSETMQIKLKDQSNKQFNNAASNNENYKISIYNKNGEERINAVTVGTSDTGDSSKLEPLKNLTFEYGDYIYIKAYQAFRLAIDGVVRNALEDYSDYVDLSDDFRYTYFKITESGLEAIFEPQKLMENESLIEFIATRGGTPFKIKFNHETKRVSFPSVTEYYNWNAGDKVVFKVHFYKNSEDEIHTFESTGKQQGVNQGLKDKLESGFDDGDYLSFEYVDIPETFYGLRITGNVSFNKDADEELKNEDFSNGIQSIKNITTLRFYPNKDGDKSMRIVRLSSASITGAEDEEVIQGESFDKTKDVRAVDTDGTDLTSSIRITGDAITSRIGLNEIKYEVTNSIGITTTVFRNINVVSKAALTLRDINMPPLELRSISNTQEEIEKYLKSIVYASDADEGDISDRIEITNTDLNPEQVGRYKASFSVTNGFGVVTKLEDVPIQVTRTISVTVPTTIPFQVVTNLIDKNADPFIAGILKLRNNRTSDVRVSVESFTKEANSGELEIVKPDTVIDWDALSEADTMRMIALGMFVESGINDSIIQRNNPLWFESNMTTETFIGTLPRATSLTTPYEAKLSFTSKHGKKFIGGSAKGKFNLVFKFE